MFCRSFFANYYYYVCNEIIITVVYGSYVLPLGEAICRVFEAATKQKAWDHFTKAQQKNITQWHGAIKNVSVLSTLLL